MEPSISFPTEALKNMAGITTAWCLMKKIARQLKQIRKICLWITLLDAVVVMWLTASMISRLVFHISSLKDRMQQFAVDNTRVPKSSCDYTERKDELGALNRQFDEMSRKIISLIQENYVNELLKKEAQIKALENQINPISFTIPWIPYAAWPSYGIRRT